MKAIKLRLALRLLAVIDVLTAERFELKAWSKHDESTTKFDKKEINEMFKK